MALPAAQTFAVIKDDILRFLKLKDDTEADALATRAIRSALVRLAVYPLKTMLATADLTLSSGENTVSVPSDYNMSMSLHFIDTSDEREGRIVQRREEDFDAVIQDSSEVGQPRIYTMRGGSALLEFDRAPAAADIAVYPKVRLRYFKRVDNLVTSTATFSIAPEVEEFLMWHGRAEMAAIYDAKKYSFAAQMASRALLDLTRRDTVRDEMDWL